ncbi:calcium-channel protein cch1 [Acrodontium crateriforme]|uniref:Calcium-channel protein CCH1 n=1 Tax=Acrodontium crateriforme TaxID=150365 RepID=A0AAQ3M4M2_9PEZI|nr:calcium-channel protein cch1 [Acrodontium crateriforme]
MASDDQFHRRSQTAGNPISIPLQDLDLHGNGAQGSGHEGSAEQGTSHRRTLSDRGRALLRGRSTKSPDKTRYAPIQEGSPEPLARNAPSGVSPVAFVTSPSGRQERIHDDEDDHGFGPDTDRGAFQAAIGFAGLSFNASHRTTIEDDDTDLDDIPPPRPERASRLNLPTLRTSASSEFGDLEPIELNDGPDFYSPGGAFEDDRVPLTDSPSLKPKRSTLAAPTTEGQRHDRNRRLSSSISVRFLTGQGRESGRDRSASMLGDELHDVESGSGSEMERSSTNRTRSLSPSEAYSPIHRTSTMIRKMSQRIVNVSNESKVLERTMRERSSSSAHARHESSPRPSTGHYPEVDGAAAPKSPASEKMPSPVVEAQPPAELHYIDRNPLRGKSLGIFPPESNIRRKLLTFLVHPLFEPFILFLIVVQTVILAVDSANNEPRPIRWGNEWTDYAIAAIFIIYTVEVVIKIIVSGFIFNPLEYSTIDRSIGLQQALKNKANNLFTLHRKPSIRVRGDEDPAANSDPSLIKAFSAQPDDDAPGGSRQAQKKRLAHRAFLRHSFNRLDFVAVVSFWISFVLAAFALESSYHIYVFRMMSCLRILRLLFITSGTSVILRSLKRSAPTLLNVAFLIGFFWLLFAIIGVQSFKSSLRRTCVWNWDNSVQGQDPYPQNQVGSFQFCGSWISAVNGSTMPWIAANGGWGTTTPKGYTCPSGSFCVEGENPYNGTVSFDNILQSVELVFVVMTSNTFTDIMYYLTDSDYLAAALFFAFGIIILTFWLISLLIAVITSSFQVIREESRSSAFMAEDVDAEIAKKEHERSPKRRVSRLRKAYEKLHWAWIAVIVFGLVVQATRHDTMGEDTAELINSVEFGVTMILLLEIILRFASDWRDFRHHRQNWIDLSLAIVTSIIQIPFIRNSGTTYAWLTVFQILRIYRVVLAIKITRDLIMVVLRHVSGVLNLILFVFLLTFLAAIFACQLFRGELPMEDSYGNVVEVNFSTIYNSFLGMYQILSSENWTVIMYNVTRFGHVHQTAWIGATFFILWFILANFVVLNMFIAVIQENFDVSEDQKRLQQVRMFLQQKEFGSSSRGTLSLSNIFKFGFVKRQDPLDFGSAATEMLLKDQVVKDFLDDMEEMDVNPSAGIAQSNTDAIRNTSGLLESWWDSIVKKLFHSEPNPFYSRLQLTKAFEELDPRTLAKEVVEATEQRKLTQREYLRKYPNYNTSLLIFKPRNPIRRFCQRIVGPGRGSERVEGVAPNPTIWYTFSAFIYAAIVAMVLLACITTPLYQREYFEKHMPFTVYNWFVFSDMGFAALFAVEAAIKVIADGFFWTPNAYLRSSWGFIDGVVLVTLWVNVVTSLRDPGGGSRAVGAFKALRALRLLNVSDSARDTFHSVIILGGWKVVSAMFVSLSLLIPFAIYGLNIFAGRMQTCNDNSSGIYNLTDCVNEYMASPYNWNFPAPRQVSNSYYDFDSFGGALFILFQIVSQEGWIDVRNSAESITGVFTQPTAFASQGNALFFVVFNLLGAVFVLTLFVSVFMRNYTEQTGVAFLTTEQRSWLELRKLLRQVAPSKRPNNKRKREGWQEWCYRRAITKNGRWQRTMTTILIIHLLLLCVEFYPGMSGWSQARDYIFLSFTLAYIANIVIRIIGLSWTRFRRSAWDVYSVFAVGGVFVTTILLLTNFQQRDYSQAHKLFLVSIALLLIPRNNQLDQLFKTAAASFGAIANLLATWFVLFLVFAIALTQTFGLTRFGSQETGNLNFRTVPKALILLFRTSVGEGWNQIMEDYAQIAYPYCTIGERYFDGDCGSPDWARALFISWNILSMYIFVNLFISLIYESFSYVYQRSSGLSVISREEIRRFKQAWAEFDPNGSGYISKEVFPRFLGELSGVFEMRIYDGDFSVRALIDDCRVSQRMSSLPVDGPSEEVKIDLEKLNRRLAELPVDQIRRRRARMNTFYEEVLVSADPDRGISFNALLMILAHYKVINDSKSLKLEEFLRRRARLQRVDEAVNRNIVVGFFDTLYWSRRFRRIKDGKKNARITEFTQFGVPEIFVQDEGDVSGVHPPQTPQTPVTRLGVPALSITPVNDSFGSLDERFSGLPRGSFDVNSPSPTSLSIQNSEADTVWTRNRSLSIQRTNTNNETSQSGLQHQPSPSVSSIQPDWHFAAGLENAAQVSQAISPPSSPRLAADVDDTGSGSANRSRANSAVNQNDMLGMFQESAWGQSVRRSFTTRRASDRDRRPSQ